MISPCLNTYIIPKRMFKKKKRIRHAFGNQNDVAKFRILKVKDNFSFTTRKSSSWNTTFQKEKKTYVLDTIYSFPHLNISLSLSEVLNSRQALFQDRKQPVFCFYQRL